MSADLPVQQHLYDRTRIHSVKWFPLHANEKFLFARHASADVLLALGYTARDNVPVQEVLAPQKPELPWTRTAPANQDVRKAKREG